MDYITIKQASVEWNIDVSRIGKLIRAGKISGVTKVGGHYLIKKGTPKPVDGRTALGKNICEKENFRYPNFAYQQVSSFFPPLSKEELQLKKVEEEFLACNYERANEILCDLPNTAKNKYCRIFALYSGCMIDIEINNVSRFFDRYNKLLLELQGNFLYKKEMSYLIYEIELLLGYVKYFIDEFKIDTTYNYHPSFTPFLVELSITSLYCNIEKVNITDINFCELSCKLLEDTTNYYVLQSVYCFLSSTFAAIKDYKKMIYYFKKALTIAQKYNCYFTVASQYFYMKNLLKPAFVDLGEKFRKKIERIANDSQDRFITFSKNMPLNSIYEKMSYKDYILILYAVKGYTNKEIANILNVSEIAIAKHYSELYNMFDITSKSELIKLYHSSINTSVLKK